MSQTIPYPQHKSSSTSTPTASTPNTTPATSGNHPHSPQLLTPSSTPPLSTNLNHGFIEQRLSNLLASMDSGTHSFCREDRDGHDMTFPGVGLPTPPASRRPSFLSCLSLTKPHGLQQLTSSTPANGSNNGSLPSLFPKDAFAHFSMTRLTDERPASDSNTTQPQQPAGFQRSKSVSVPKSTAVAGMLKSSPNGPAGDLMNTVPPPPAGQIGRAKTDGELVQRQVGFDSDATTTAPTQSQRHFDPSKDPRLFGLL